MVALSLRGAQIYTELDIITYLVNPATVAIEENTQLSFC